MRTPSSPVPWLLALALVFAQAAAALHELEHLAPDVAAGASAAEIGVASGSSRPVATDTEATASAHADDAGCVLCLALGAGQAHARSTDTIRVSAAAASTAIGLDRSAMPADRSTRGPPARAPPAPS